MIPSDYRLETVCARLVERFEGTRRSYVGRPEEAGAEFERVAREQVAAAVAEWNALELDDDLDVARHGTFLAREVEQTFLPRYRRLAEVHTAKEDGGYGFGLLARPSGRLALVLGALVAVLVLGRLALIAFPVWALVLAALSLPLWPDVAALLEDRRYEQDLRSLLGDLARVQGQSEAYARPEQLRSPDSDLPKSREQPGSQSQATPRRPSRPSKETP